MDGGKEMMLLGLFLQFLKYGLLCFGGGYMIIPLLYADLVEKTSTLTPESYGNLLAVSQMTPGAVSINTATYVGFMQDSVWGSIAATLGLCTPTFILCVIILSFLNFYKNKPWTIGFLKGIKWAAFIMILSAVILFAKISVLDLSNGLENIKINLLELGIMAVAICLAKKVPFTVLLLLSACIGWGVSYL